MTTGPARALLRRLGQYLDGFSGCFSRQPQREAASRSLDGLLNDSERKSMQAMHGRLSDPGQYQALQHFITHSPWEPVTWGTGTAGPLTARFCALRVRPKKGRGDRWLLCERSATDERKYYLLHVPETTALVDLVTLGSSRWPIEQQYRELKDDLGLDHFEGRTYQGWAHHVVLTAVAFTFLQIERGGAADQPRPTLPIVRGWVREIMGLLYVIHNRRLRSMLDSFRRHAPLRR